MQTDPIQTKPLPPITAILTDAAMIEDAYGWFLVGNVFDDVRERWENGRKIFTSRIEAGLGWSAYRTLCGSVFLVHSWRPDHT